MSQQVVYVSVDNTTTDADAVTGNGATVPTITGTTTVALTYDPATINLHQLQKATEAFLQFAQQNANGSNAAGATYMPVGTGP